MRRRVMLLMLWLLGVALAAGAGFAAVGLVGGELTGLGGQSRGVAAVEGLAPPLGEPGAGGSSGASGSGGATTPSVAPSTRPAQSSTPSASRSAGGSSPVVGSAPAGSGSSTGTRPVPTTTSTPGTATSAPGSGTPTTHPDGGGTASPDGSGSATVTRTYTTTGGSVVGSCSGSVITLLSWSPAPGWQVSDVSRGPDQKVEVTFVTTTPPAQGPTQVKVEGVCSSGTPVFSSVSGSGDH
ncbi:MAG: hypothetical protein ACYCYA_12095 [Actinomycetes bacterium]